jgi:hypothetical protein
MLYLAYHNAGVVVVDLKVVGLALHLYIHVDLKYKIWMERKKIVENICGHGFYIFYPNDVWLIDFSLNK